MWIAKIITKFTLNTVWDHDLGYLPLVRAGRPDWSIHNKKYVIDQKCQSIDPFSLYVLLPHFRPRDGTLENHFFQILKYLRVYE